ncbi:MAG TPA: hypothetical protein VLD67_09270 [Vicinamibacterales bacterium]|nr:hypothetical protein [Vicinamibacterales bacterium]
MTRTRLLAAGFAVTLVFATAVSADHSWGPYHWARASNPLTVVFGDNVDSRWDGWLVEAADDWSMSAVLDATIAGGQAKGNCRPADGRAEVCNGNYGFNGWLGIAQIWVSGSHIVKGAVKLNDSYHDFAPYNENGWRDLVMCQEVGHIFGLAHQDEDFDNGNLGTCMDYTGDPDGPPANRQPDQHDYNMLADIYSHLDEGGGTGGNGCKGSPSKCAGSQPRPPAFDMDLPGVGQWGRHISTSRDGGQSVFVQDFGGGHRVYTHVTWTLDAAARLARR